ncbi:GntR family transcriptional regulator [Shimia sediminis]|uniref:GntR family transcriptional regulator n=1 Tax=Shimia sediminis TaxID=2497945 RepID=UPI001F164331|nr:GntR family transcriptional regulator [Shimia sediminis]
MISPMRHNWKSVRDEVAARILRSDYAPGDRLPRDEELAAELGCARSTVVRAMQDLADSGIVERRRKGGTRVPANPVTRATFDIPVTRSEIEARGQSYGYHLLEQTPAPSPLHVTTAFGLSAPQDMLHLRALHLADQKPYIFEDRWIALNTVPEIRDVDLTTLSANEWLVKNRPYSRCTVRFYATNAGSDYGPIFATDPTTPLFVVERTTWVNDAPITSVKAIAHPGYQMLTEVG